MLQILGAVDLRKLRNSQKTVHCLISTIFGGKISTIENLSDKRSFFVFFCFFAAFPRFLLLLKRITGKKIAPGRGGLGVRV